MFIDIHKHGEEESDDVLVLRNLFPHQVDQVKENKYYSLGLHPWHVEKGTMDSNLSIIDKNIKRKEIIAIGEIGLDNKVDVSYRDQLLAFEKQIELAEKYKRPMVIHCVKAYDDLITIRKKNNITLPWIVHWFNSSNQMAQNLIDLNCYLSYGYMLFVETSKAYRGFSSIPSDRIFLETDDTEYNIHQVYDRAAKIMNIKPIDLQYKVQENFINCFQIDL